MSEVSAVIYARYSSHNQREESIEGQLRECKRYAQDNGITVVGEYIDRAIADYNRALHVLRFDLPSVPRRVRAVAVRQAAGAAVENGDVLARLAAALEKGQQKKVLALCREGFGVPVAQAAEALADAAVPGRFETVTHPAQPGVTYIIDYAHNGLSLAAILDTLRAYRPTRLICLFGSVGERTTGRRAELALAAANRADLCILTSDNPGCEPPEDIIREIDASFPPGACPRLRIPDRADAIRAAVALARPGDMILLAGKGHEDYQLIGTSRLPFRERDILTAALDACSTAKANV